MPSFVVSSLSPKNVAISNVCPGMIKKGSSAWIRNLFSQIETVSMDCTIPGKNESVAIKSAWKIPYNYDNLSNYSCWLEHEQSVVNQSELNEMIILAGLLGHAIKTDVPVAVRR